MFTLGRAKPNDPVGDPLGRAEMGWRPGLTEEQVWARGRGNWKFSPARARTQALAAVTDPEGIVRAVARVESVAASPGGRYRVEGPVLPGHGLIGTSIPQAAASRNPVSYVTDPI